MTILDPAPRRSRMGVARVGGRRRLVAGAVAAAVVAGVVVAATNPFGSSPPAAGVSDNSYPTATTTVKRESISSQTSVSATLGFAGSDTITVPSGTPASALVQDEHAVTADEAKVAEDRSSLKAAKASATPSARSTILAATQTVTTDEAAVEAAKAQLASDERLGCPASSSSTVTGALGGSSTPSGSSPSGGSSPTSGSPSASGLSSAHDPPSAPTVTTGAATVISATSERLAGTVAANGSDTTYYFEWGATSSFGHTTPVTDAGSGTTAVSVSATITGLAPNTTYQFALVAVNADGTGRGDTVQFKSAESSCVAEQSVVSADEAVLTEAKDALAVDKIGARSAVTSAKQVLASDEAALATARQVLAADRTKASNPNTTFTAVPSVGDVIRRGDSVYSLDGQPVPLFYGAVTMYRALYLGVANGSDVKELNENLIALGFGSGINAGAHFSKATEAGVKAWQRSLGEPTTGVVALGDVAVEAGPIEVTSVSAVKGGQANPGAAVLSATSTSREVTINLDAAQQSQVKVGDSVTVTLPDNSTTPGVVSSVGTVATSPSGGGGPAGNTGTSTPTITVEVTLRDPKAAGKLDQAPVDVAITNARVPNALVVPVDALLALSSGGYALEEVAPNGSHHLVAVTPGLFDDANGLVQVSGSGVVAGAKIVIPHP